ncbi:TrkH family potassium uptake protein [Parvularcula flava]|uniref:Trk system potassium uptake protein n=1 Tax=Aquisalinus luteolus TaxID=1566827 RepID=A0A8J3A6U9_9PROT|nr:potassium transporter TrkG [Aquisalinus luteolus]NHK27659.1 TrkH family potassium uptake protein [Aquisalinus luteolus]GGH96110.1 Trk system potassium uptake protein [Aquisalinus luteolus]
MNALALLWWIGAAIAVLAGAMVIPAISCIASGDYEGLSVFALSLITCGTIGGGFMLISRNRVETSHSKAGIREITLFLLVWWGVIPVLGGLPFLLSGFSLGDAWFESVSAVTTTGAWLSQEAARADYAQMLWRAQLQWLGGLVSISSAAAVFIRPQFIGIDVVNTPFARGEQESFLRAFRKAVSVFLPIYSLIALVIFILFVVTGAPPSSAVIMALSFTASGGFVPDAEGFASYGAFVPVAGLVAMILGGISFVSVARLLAPYDTSLRFRDDRETPVFLTLVVAITLIFALSVGTGIAGITDQLLNAASLLSTNGILTGEQPALTPVLVTAIIGGASISAAGGIKLVRWLVTFERAGEEIWKLIHPSGVLGKARAVNELGVWVHFVAFTIILSVLVLVITIYGTPLELSVTTAVSVISNAGPMIAAAPGGITDYNTFDPLLRVLLALGMIVGRIEMVVALSILNRAFWRG